MKINKYLHMMKRNKNIDIGYIFLNFNMIYTPYTFISIYFKGVVFWKTLCKLRGY